MKWFHLIFGIAVFLVFTQTGSLMRADFPDKDAIPQDLRLLMGSRHIYILFAALIHIVLGVYLQLRQEIVLRVLQLLGSIVITIGSILLVYAWYVETYEFQHFSDLSRNGIYLTALGVGLHLFGIVLPTRKR
jgi:MFS superfamily sulfate permease-like transporter